MVGGLRGCRSSAACAAGRARRPLAWSGEPGTEPSGVRISFAVMGTNSAGA